MVTGKRLVMMLIRERRERGGENQNRGIIMCSYHSLSDHLYFFVV